MCSEGYFERCRLVEQRLAENLEEVRRIQLRALARGEEGSTPEPRGLEKLAVLAVLAVVAVAALGIWR